MLFVERFIIFLITFIISLNAVSCEDLLELACVDTHDCMQFKLPGVNVTCNNGQCRCSIASNNSTAENKFIKCSPIDLKQSNIIGGPCPCRMPHAECNETQNICYCEKNFMASVDKRRCVRETVALGEKCELDEQCHESDHHAICSSINNKCTCRRDFIAHNESCISVADPNTTCQSDQDCQKYGAHVKCLLGTQKCTCLNGFIKALNKSECLPIAAYNEKCTEHQQCQTHLGPGGSCINGTCDCSDRHYLLQEKVQTETKDNVTLSSCARIIEIGEYCLEDKDCYHHQFPDEEQTMSCIFSECNCKWGYNSINNMECIKSSKGSLIKPMLKFFMLSLFAIVGANLG